MGIPIALLGVHAGLQASRALHSVLTRAIVPLLEQLGRAVVQEAVLFSNSTSATMVLANTEGAQTAEHTGYLQSCRLQCQRLLCMWA